MKFNDYKIDDIKKAMVNLIKRHKTIASATQEMIMGLAYEIEANGSVQELNDFIYGLSEQTEDKLYLSVTARAVGVYMGDLLPVEWVKADNAFIMSEGAEGFDYTVSLEVMLETRWDKYKVKPPEHEFCADNSLTKAMAMIKGIIAQHAKGNLQDDDPAFVTARRIAKAF